MALYRQLMTFRRRWRDSAENSAQQNLFRGRTRLVLLPILTTLCAIAGYLHPKKNLSILYSRKHLWCIYTLVLVCVKIKVGNSKSLFFKMNVIYIVFSTLLFRREKFISCHFFTSLNECAKKNPTFQVEISV